MKCAVIVFAAFNVGALCSAHAEERQYAWMGIGVSTCSDLAEYYRFDADEADNTLFSWAQGFMSGLNEVRRQQGLPTVKLNAKDYGPDWQQKRMHSYCDGHPSSRYVAGALIVFSEMGTAQGLAGFSLPKKREP